MHLLSLTTMYRAPHQPSATRYVLAKATPTVHEQLLTAPASHSPYHLAPGFTDPSSPYKISMAKRSAVAKLVSRGLSVNAAIGVFWGVVIAVAALVLLVPGSILWFGYCRGRERTVAVRVEKEGEKREGEMGTGLLRERSEVRKERRREVYK